MIHSSHSRKDLLDIIDIYKLGFDELLTYKLQTKQELLKNLWIVIQKKDIILSPLDDTFFFFDNVNDIKSYLMNKSPNKLITDKTLLEITKKVKQINYYCLKCSYEVEFSNYNTLNDIFFDANYIRFYGNIPSVRRSIKLLNLDSKLNDKFEIIMSNKVKKTIEEKERIKRSLNPTYCKKVGSFTVIFE